MKLLLLIGALYVNPVTISVYPAVGLPPATFRITVLVPRHAANRRLCYQTDGPELKRSCIDLAGEDARRVFTVYWELRTSGEYEASATLTRNVEGRNQVHVSRQAFRVLGLEY